MLEVKRLGYIKSNRTKYKIKTKQLNNQRFGKRSSINIGRVKTFLVKLPPIPFNIYFLYILNFLFLIFFHLFILSYSFLIPLMDYNKNQNILINR
jgi:hypothetical protein